MTARDCDAVIACVLAADVTNELERLTENVAHAAEPSRQYVVRELQRISRAHELVCASLAALRDGTDQDVRGARTALRVAAVELERLAKGVA